MINIRIRRQRPLLMTLITGMLVMALLAPLAVTSVQAQQGTGQITNASRVNLRQGPGVNFNIVTILSAGQLFTIVGRNADGSWVQIILPGNVQGWVNARYVLPSIPVNTLPQTANTTVTGATVNSPFLNLRDGPGANFNIITTLAEGQPLNLLGRNADNSWVQVNVPGGATGWVSARFIQSNILVGNLPLVSNTGVFPTFPQAVPTGGRTGVVTAFNLNVRYGPGTQFGRFAILRQGEGVSLIGRNGFGNWLLVQLANGATGWVNTGFIRTDFPIGELEVRG